MTQIPIPDLNESERLWLEKLYQLRKENKKIDFREINCSLDGKISNDFHPMALWHRLADASGERLRLLGIVAVERSFLIINKCNLVIGVIKKIILQDPKIENIRTTFIAERSNLPLPETTLILDLINEYGRFWRDVKYDTVGGIESIRVTGEDNIFYEYRRFTNLEGLILSKLNEDEQKQQSKADNIPSNMPQNNFSAITVNFVNTGRLQEIKSIRHRSLDFQKLIRLCEELNDNFRRGNYLSVGMIGRTILNHIPPIFDQTSFDEVANNYGGQKNNLSFKKNMRHLNESLKNIADGYLHLQIRETEVLPNETQVDFKQDLDVLLAEIVRISFGKK